MFREFEKAPSRSSYQLKFVLAALALIALVAAWVARSNTVHDLKSTQLERDQVTLLLDERSVELQSAEQIIVDLEAEQSTLKEAIASGESELASLREHNQGPGRRTGRDAGSAGRCRSIQRRTGRAGRCAECRAGNSAGTHERA